MSNQPQGKKIAILVADLRNTGAEWFKAFNAKIAEGVHEGQRESASASV
jgi:hypothetical protein